MTGRIVLFGATGYTGELTARALVARGARPVLAGRSAERLDHLAAELGRLEAHVADSSRPRTLRGLVARGDVLVSTVGPFVRWGDAAAQVAVGAGAHYLDSTGEPAFIRRIFEHYGPAAAAAGCAMVPAFGFDWVPGNLAGALAVDAAGQEATAVRIGYFPRGGGVSGGTAASAWSTLLQPSFAYRDGRLRSERLGARVVTFRLGSGARRRGISVGGSEHLALPRAYSWLRDVEVALGLAGRPAWAVPAVTGALTAATRVPGIQTVLARRGRQGSAGGPDAERRRGGSAVVVGEARSVTGQVLRRVELRGPDPYAFTADMLAWGAMTAADGGVRDVGALGPVAAFGLGELTAGAAEAGLTGRGGAS